MNKQYLSSACARSVDHPVCVDLDGTLIHSDMLLESLVRALKQKPWLVFFLPMWLARGKAYLKSQLASIGKPDPSVLPYDQRIIGYLKQQKAQGRKLVLASGSHHSLVQPVADHLQLFDEVLASDDKTNLTGTNKVTLLKEKYGDQQFDYIGNDRADLKVWPHAAGALIANASQSVKSAAADLQFVEEFPAPDKQAAKTFFKGIRIHQWVKNLLVFVPLMTSHQLNLLTFSQSVLAFIAFGFCASAVYLINDLMDLDSDRHHHSKCNRPLASGKMSIMQGVLLTPVFMLISALICISLPMQFAWVLGAYFVVTMAYSLRLKKTELIDVLLLAGLYTVRVVAGAAAISVELSFWLLAFSIFLFFSLAMIKRLSELDKLQQDQGEQTESPIKEKARGRGYVIADIQILQIMAATSGYSAVVVLAMYINNKDIMSLYPSPQLLWALCPIVLLWISRMLLLTSRGEMNEDPVVFAIRDRISWVLGGIAGVALIAATLGL
ncbi:UbiA family prenyltransferase [Pelagibaculum spongiae]|uniref:UbiA family prenyltransferase n=1 Tax=Pelagibaculum spongiae TaxID=2080658 RepID=A0A2V1GTC6_9GAMM|nr:UbiA family prenyltransferase [Pelagibaculum spongiae]PVZ68925.1 UbiA family prenyltransferase [Pelagibaculum spongiae]